MEPVDIVGKLGRAVTEVGTAGRVEVDGSVYDAMTVRPPIPAGSAIQVTGWRIVGDAGCVLLSVRLPGDDSRRGHERREGLFRSLLSDPQLGREIETHFTLIGQLRQAEPGAAADGGA